MVEVLVLFNYDGQESDELTIRKGDVIREVVKQGGGWWEGLLGSRRGVFPDNFVTVVTEAEMNNSTATSSSSAAVSRAGKGKMCKALFDYSPVHEDELALKVGEDIVFLEEVEEGWWRGKLGQKEGVFPSNFVMMLEDANSSSSKTNGNSTPAVDNHSAASPEVAPELPPKPIKELAKVLFSYSATQIDELELREGDIVTILSKDCEDKGWWKGKLNNKIGVFPDNFVELLPQNQNGIHKKLSSTSAASSVSSGVAATPQIRNSLIIPSGEVTGSDTSDARSPLDRKAITDAFLAGMAAQTPKEVPPPVNNSLSDEQKLLQADKVDLLDAIAPTEALSHPSRIRPAKRRPPSSAFNKDGGLLVTFDEPSPSVNGTNGLAVQREESVEQADARSVSSGEMPQLPVTKARTSPVKPPWMEELKRSQEKRGSALVPAPSSSEEHNKSPVPPPTLKPTVPKVAPATPAPSSHVNNKSTSPLTSRDSSESAKSAANLNTKTPSVGSSSSSSGADTYKMNLSNSNSSMNKQTSGSSLVPGSRPGIPGEKPSVSPSVKPAKSPTTTHIEAPKSSGPVRPAPNSAIKSSSSTTNVPTKSHITSDNNDNVQNEVESLRVRVGTLEATVEQLQASVQQLRQMLEDERKSRSANMLIHI